MLKKRSKKMLWAVYGIFFFYNLHLAFGIYINSSFLADACGCGIPENMVGILFSLGAFGGAVATLMARRLSVIAGSAKRLLIATVIGALASLIGFVFSKSPFVVATLFALYWTLSYLFNFIADILVESYSDDSTTGDTRGIFLTIAGLGTMMAPFAAGRLSENEGGFTIVYMIAMGLLLVSIIGLLFFSKKIKEPKFNKSGIIAGLKTFFKNKNYAGAFSINFLLQFFFSWMIIYTPIYLNQYIGLGWTQIGIIFTVMLTPFVLIEIPLGQLADKLLGEKEILITGTLIISISTAALAFLHSTSIGLWMLLLVMTRVGASAVQVASESYFFKQVSEKDIGHISIFRLTTPLAFMFGPLVGTALLAINGFQFSWLFIVVAIIMLFGIPMVARIKDTR